MAALGVLTLQGAALASTYDALCGGADCTISVTGDIISGPGVSIPTNQVTTWGMGGSSKTSVGTGVATTIVFGPLGLLGFLAKNDRFDVNVSGYDVNGDKASLAFTFRNKRPARAIVQQLQVVTGLGMHQVRSKQQILDNLANGGDNLNISVEARSIAQVNSNLFAKPVKPKNCWSAYLKARPDMKAWADANPAAAAKTKAKYDDC